MLSISHIRHHVSKLSKGPILVLSSFLLLGCGQLNLKEKLSGPRPEKKFFRPHWIKNLDVPYDTGNLPIGLQSPTIHEGILYIGHNIGVMKAFDLNNGREIWEGQDNKPYHSAPTVYDNLLIYGNAEGRLFARDRLSGELVYNIDLGSAVESEPTVHKGRILVHTRNHKVVALDALTGKILWAYKRSVPFLTTLQRVSRPQVEGNKVYVGFADGFLCSFSLEEGILLWESKVVNGNKFIDVDTYPIFYNGKIIVGSQSGNMSVLNPNGGIVERQLPYVTSRNPIVWNDFLLIGTSEGEVVRLDNGFKEVNKIKVSNGSITSMVLWKQKLIASTTKGELISVNPDLKKEFGRFEFGHSSSALFGKLVVSGENLAAYSSRNRLYVFK